jgi:hypothetical protein
MVRIITENDRRIESGRSYDMTNIILKLTKIKAKMRTDSGNLYLGPAEDPLPADDQL